MNDKKISFISCVNNKTAYKEMLFYIHAFEIPEGYEIDCLSVENAPSMTAGYNKAMKQSDAKYKVYLHQDVFILNHHFIREMLDLFQVDETIGLTGLTGAKHLLPSFVWWLSDDKYGCVYNRYNNKLEKLSFSQPRERCETVAAVDGMLLMTQIGNYLKLLGYFKVHISDETFSSEKRKLLDKFILPWCSILSNSNINLTLDGMIEFYSEAYRDEPYYEEYLNKTSRILRPDDSNKQGLLND